MENNAWFVIKGTLKFLFLLLHYRQVLNLYATVGFSLNIKM